MASSSNRPVALFDLDGTITDPQSGITRCIVHALEELQVDVPSYDTLKLWIGPPLHQSFADHLGSEASADEALKLYRERFSSEGLYENELFEGIVEALTEIRQSTDRMMVVTSKPTVFAIRIIEHFGLRRYFDAVHGSELDGTRGDKTEVLGYVLNTEKILSECATMTGDRRHDVLAAKRHGVKSVGVLWGFGDREELLTAGADHLCTSVSELPGYFTVRN